MIQDVTRSVFDSLHRDQAHDPDVLARLVSLLSTEYLELASGWFSGKICLDAGCGSNAHAVISMVSLGAQKVIALDLDESISVARKVLVPFQEKYGLVGGDLASLPFEGECFDFVHCSGVLHHMENVGKSRLGFCELARVTKRGGVLYVAIEGKGGLLAVITDVLRRNYAETPSLKEIIDGLNQDDLKSYLGWILDELAEREGGRVGPLESAFLLSLIDNDLILTIKDRIQAPRYIRFAEEEVREWFEEEGFGDVRRLRRYPRYRNLRRFLAPLYYHYDHPLASLLYGEGILQLRGFKK